MDDAQFSRFVDPMQLQHQELRTMFIEFGDRIEQRMDRLEQRMDKLEQRMDKLEQWMDAMHTEMLERFESVLDRLNDLEKRVGVIGANVEALQIQVFDLRGDVQRIEKRLTDVETASTKSLYASVVSAMTCANVFVS